VKLSFFFQVGFGYLVLWWHPQCWSRNVAMWFCCTKEMLSCDFAYICLEFLVGQDLEFTFINICS
jgi:hypothetical protein